MRNHSAPLVWGLGILTISALLLYFRLRKKKASGKPASESILEFTVPNNCVPVVVGKDGETLRQIEQVTGTVIEFREQDENNHVCQVRGEVTKANEAERLIKEKIAAPSKTITEEMKVPATARGKILGPCGDKLEEIKELSGAKVWIEDLKNDSEEVLVKIYGTPEQMSKAKQLVAEQVKLVQPKISAVTEAREVLPPKTESLKSHNSADQMEVYVSAVVSPSKFYVQILGPQNLELDLFIEEMTKYYGAEENRAKHVITEPELNQLVAAKFEGDDRWYRAQVASIAPSTPGKPTVCDLFFPDFGDNLYVYPHEIFELKQEFLGLKYQAVECFLAYVRPVNSENPNQWSKKANDRFDELVHVAQWKRLVAKTVTFRQSPSDNKVQIPGIELYDVEKGRDIDIAQTLINENLAQRSTTGYFGDLLKSSVLKLDDDTPSPLPPLSSLPMTQPSKVELPTPPASVAKEVTPEPLTLNITEVTEKKVLDEARKDRQNNNEQLRGATTGLNDFLSMERQQNGNGTVDTEELVRQTLAEGEETVKQWSDLLKSE